MPTCPTQRSLSFVYAVCIALIAFAPPASATVGNESSEIDRVQGILLVSSTVTIMFNTVSAACKAPNYYLAGAGAGLGIASLVAYHAYDHEAPRELAVAGGIAIGAGLLAAGVRYALDRRAPVSRVRAEVHWLRADDGHRTPAATIVLSF